MTKATKTTLTKHNDSGEIIRDPVSFANKRYDIIIVGGGIYGVMLCLEACRRGLSPLLLEANDFGSQTSFNHLRIIHGGLRYLQNFDLKRFFESISERAWFLNHYPDLVIPLNCLMPLYGNGLKRPAIFKIALALNDLLAAHINCRISKDNRLSNGAVISPEKTCELFPSVNKNGLQGAAIWQDGFATHSPRLLIELVRWACVYGGKALNYFQAENLIVKAGKIEGIKAKDFFSGKDYEFMGATVINAAGPWCREISRKWHQDIPRLFPHRILVWNILFDRPALSSSALAISPPTPNAHTYFLPPWHGRLMAGTGHAVIEEGEHRPPNEHEIEKMIADLNAAIPGLELQKHEIRRVLWGNMPGTQSGSLGSREVVVDHGKEGGPKGAYSISGVKFTTARLVADSFLNKIFPQFTPKEYNSSFSPPKNRGFGPESNLSNNKSIQGIIASESVTSLADLVLRRTDFADTKSLEDSDLKQLAGYFMRNNIHVNREIEEIKNIINYNK